MCTLSGRVSQRPPPSEPPRGHGALSQNRGHEGGGGEEGLPGEPPGKAPLPWANFLMAQGAQGNSDECFSCRSKWCPDGRRCLRGHLQRPQKQPFPGAGPWEDLMSYPSADLRAEGAAVRGVLCGPAGLLGPLFLGRGKGGALDAEAERLGRRLQRPPLPGLGPAGAQLGCLFTWGGLGEGGRPGEADSRQVPSVIAFGHLKGIV